MSSSLMNYNYNPDLEPYFTQHLKTFNLRRFLTNKKRIMMPTLESFVLRLEEIKEADRATAYALTYNGPQDDLVSDYNEVSTWEPLANTIDELFYH